MKLQNKWFIGAMLGAAVCLVSTSCVDEIKFGNSFLDKAPGGNATIDTVFNSAEYTRQFLNTCYSRQYYGLPYNTDSNGNIPDSSSPYLGKKDALTDCWSLYFSDATVYQQYYLGSLNANYGTRGNIFPYTREMVWEVVRWCWLLMENIDRVPGMDSTEKTQLVAEAKCLIAARYFDMFRHYGGLPLLYASFTGTESGYEIPRATAAHVNSILVNIVNAYNKAESKKAEEGKREACLLPHISSHILRHTACTRMAEAEVDVKILQNVMGYSDINTTMNIYNHIDFVRVRGGWIN